MPLWIFVLALTLRIFCAAQMLHSLWVFEGWSFRLSGCPTGQEFFLALTAEGPNPLMTFSLIVTGSRWSGLTHEGLWQRWSRTRPSGTSPFASS